jgi:hypothetical protein
VFFAFADDLLGGRISALKRARGDDSLTIDWIDLWKELHLGDDEPLRRTPKKSRAVDASDGD